MNPRLEKQVHQLYEQYHREIFGYIFFMVGERQQALDLMQDTFVKAFLNFENFRGDANPKTWLYKIARNVTIDYQRKKKPTSYVIDYFTPITSDQPTPEEVAELGDNTESLYRALSRLKKAYRDVIVLRKIEEFSTKEAAAILGWKESRIKTNLHRGLEALRKEMLKEGYTSETV